jgi:hypothetical protein
MGCCVGESGSVETAVDDCKETKYSKLLRDMNVDVLNIHRCDFKRKVVVHYHYFVGLETRIQVNCFRCCLAT